MAGGVVVSWMKYRLSGVVLAVGERIKGGVVKERSSNTYPVTGIMWDVVETVRRNCWAEIRLRLSQDFSGPPRHANTAEPLAGNCESNYCNEHRSPN